jgi:hypothetical protein
MTRPIGRHRPPARPNRAPIPWAAVRAAYDAHQDAAHHGRPGRACRTCTRYTAAVTLARRRENEALS